ncbi:MAG: Lrp/AsnC ligand binding domain-containing protein [Pseudoflavonifractor sp.]|nr:Lrp/AsnC ligand binding domain-containing protein [Alloprevotella sp.]MCM1117104.1 Lrp/AsnC ligand binding domain-containing protein [Pseudoflavonifractor sp.]
MSRQQLDNLDCRILEMLTANARVPFLEIARECGVSGASIHQRIQKLTAQGVVKGFETLMDPTSIGYETCAYVGLSLNNPQETDHVVDLLREIVEVVECNATTGRYDILIKVYARNNDHLFDIIKNRIAPIGAGRTETLIAFSEGFRRQVVIGAPVNF